MSSKDTAQGDLALDDLRSMQDDCLFTVRRSTMALLAFTVFCLLTIGIPDRKLFGNELTVSIPFAGVAVDFVSFLVVGPIILVFIWAYIQVFLEELTQPRLRNVTPRTLVLPLLPRFIPQLFSELVNTFLPPVIVLLIAFKAAFLPWASAWFLSAATVFALSLGLRARRLYLDGRRSLGNLLTVLLVISTLACITLAADVTLATRLSPLDLHEASLTGADVRNLRLSHANLVKARMDDANLNQTDLSGANLRQAELTGAKLGGANLRDTRLDGADFTKAKLVRALLNNAKAEEKVNFAHAELVGAKLRGVKFHNADMSFANLSAADLSSAEFTKADFSRADLSSARISGGKLIGVELHHAELAEADFSMAKLSGESDLSFAVLRQAILSGADLTDADLTHAILSEATLEDALLVGADLTDAELNNSRLSRAQLIAADLTKADLREARLDHVNMRDAVLDRTVLVGADLTGSDLVGADLSNADLTGADLTGARFTDEQTNDVVNLTQAQVASACYREGGQPPKLPSTLVPPPHCSLQDTADRGGRETATAPPDVGQSGNSPYTEVVPGSLVESLDD